jgi:hypothetical protein
MVLFQYVFQLLVDTSSLDTPAAEIARPWTPSYLVHSQGSPLHGATDLEEVAAPIEVAPEHADDELELSELEFATNEEAPVPAIPVLSQEQPEEPVATPEAEHEETVADLPVEEVQPSFEAPASKIDDAPAEEPSIVVEGVATPAEQVPVEDWTSTEVLPALESGLDATKVTEALLAEDVQTEKGVPQVPELVLDTSEEVTEVSNSIKSSSVRLTWCQ